MLLHQPSGGAEGQSVDIEIQAREILRMRDLLNEILAEKTGKTAEEIDADTDRDFILDAEQAKAYGIVDEIIVSRKAQERAPAVTWPDGARRGRSVPSSRPGTGGSARCRWAAAPGHRSGDDRGH